LGNGKKRGKGGGVCKVGKTPLSNGAESRKPSGVTLSVPGKRKGLISQKNVDGKWKGDVRNSFEIP